MNNDRTESEAAAVDVDSSGHAARMVWAILTPAERRQLVLLAPAVVLMAILETAGVASIVPFLGLLSDPAAVETNVLLHRVYVGFGFASKEALFFAVGGGVLCLVTVGNAVSAATTWALLRFSWMRNHSLSTRLLGSYFSQEYEFFLTKNSTDLGKNILAEAQAVVTGVIVQALQLAARFVVVLGVFGSLLVLDPVMALSVLGVFGGVYGIIFIGVRRTTAARGRERVRLNQQRFKLAQEALSGIKELKLYQREQLALQTFADVSQRFATLQADNSVIAQLPKFAIETLAFGGVLGMVMYWLQRGRVLTEVLPVLGLYAFAAYRMLPALQVVFSGLTALRFNMGSLEVLHRDLVESEANRARSPTSLSTTTTLDGSIVLRKVSFRYRGAEQRVLDDVSIDIAVGGWVALVGPTGAGKSTLVDVLVGLLAPESGDVVVGDVVVNDDDKRHAWQRNVAYVPQQIFLIDDTVIRNIAFGVADADIDRARVEHACQIAQIHDFIVSELPGGYEAVIGERGVRLSGGQRQRLGIARALYRRPSFLVLDEATSALDNTTEARFFAALHREFAHCAVVSIAHRLSTTRDFDRIYVLERGRVVDAGTYAELAARSPHFRLGDGPREPPSTTAQAVA